MSIFDWRRRLLGADPFDDLDTDADHIGVYELVVRDVDSQIPWGKQLVSDFERNPPATNGYGHLLNDAFGELKEGVEPEEHVGEVVGRVAIDVDDWSFTVRREIDS